MSFQKLCALPLLAVISVILLGGLTSGCTPKEVDRCLVNGVAAAHLAERGGNSCQICDIEQSTETWSPRPDGTSCGDGLICLAGECTPQCVDEDLRLNPGERHPENFCLICEVHEGIADFANVPAGEVCGTDLYCFMGFCRELCVIDGEIHEEGPHPDDAQECRACLPEVSTTSWSVAPDGEYFCPDRKFCLDGKCVPGCWIGGERVELDSPHPTEPCRYCPPEGRPGWANRPEREVCGEQMECRRGECIAKTLDFEFTALSDSRSLLAVARAGNGLRAAGSGIWLWDEEAQDWISEEGYPSDREFVAIGNYPQHLQALALDSQGWLWSDHGGDWSLREDKGQLLHARALSVAGTGSQRKVFFVGDEGKTWIWSAGGVSEPPVELATPTDSDLKAVLALSSGLAWAVGENGTVLRFDGSNWVAVNTGHEENLLTIWAQESESASGSVLVVAAGEGGVIMRSEDGGQTWEKQLLSDADGADIHALAEAQGDLFAVGESGVFLASSNGGKTWRPQRTGLQGRETLHALWVGPMSVQESPEIWVLAVGEDGQGGFALRGK